MIVRVLAPLLFNVIGRFGIVIIFVVFGRYGRRLWRWFWA
jgi:hypothetical protein